MNRDEERYIGDGHFVRFDGSAVRLRKADHEMSLRPKTLATFERFVRDVRADIKRWLPEVNEPPCGENMDAQTLRENMDAAAQTLIAVALRYVDALEWDNTADPARVDGNYDLAAELAEAADAYQGTRDPSSARSVGRLVDEADPTSP